MYIRVVYCYSTEGHEHNMYIRVVYCYSTEAHRRVYIFSFVEQVHCYMKPVYRKPHIHNGYLRLRKFGLQLQSANRMVVVLD